MAITATVVSELSPEVPGKVRWIAGEGTEVMATEAIRSVPAHQSGRPTLWELPSLEVSPGPRGRGSGLGGIISR